MSTSPSKQMMLGKTIITILTISILSFSVLPAAAQAEIVAGDRMEYTRDSNIFRIDGKYYFLILQDTDKWSTTTIDFASFNPETGKLKKFSAAPAGTIRRYDDRWTKKLIHKFENRVLFAFQNKKEGARPLVYSFNGKKVNKLPLGENGYGEFEPPGKKWKKSSKRHTIIGSASVKNDMYVLTKKSLTFEKTGKKKTIYQGSSNFHLYKTNGTEYESVALPDDVDRYSIVSLRNVNGRLLLGQYKSKKKDGRTVNSYRALELNDECSCMQKAIGDYKKIGKALAGGVEKNGEFIARRGNKIKRLKNGKWKKIPSNKFGEYLTLAGSEKLTIALLGTAKKPYTIGDKNKLKRIGKNTTYSFRGAQGYPDGIAIGVNAGSNEYIDALLISKNGKTWRKLELDDTAEYYNFNIVGKYIVFPTTRIKISDLPKIEI